MGGVKSMLIYGSGHLLDFPFGFSVGLFHFQKGFTGKAKIVIGMKAIQEAIKNFQ